MGLFDFLRRGRAPDPSFDVDDLVSDYWRLYLKGLAIDKSAEFLARAAASSEFRFQRQGQGATSPWLRLLNVAPNRDESAPMFWQRVVYQLVTKNEVLIVKSDDDQLLVADGYYRKEYALYEDVFEGVVVKGYQFVRSFKMSEVIFLQYNNNRMLSYVEGLFDDYEKLHQKLLEAIGRNNQIRGSVSMRANARLDDATTKKMQAYANGLFKSFQSKSVAIVPLMDGLEYKELTNTTGTSSLSVEELKKLRRQFDDEVAELIGIPPALLHGEMANLENSQELFNTYCLGPLLRKLEAEINAKLLTVGQVTNGEAFKVIGLNSPDIFDLANSIDKLIASGAFNPNEIRLKLNYEAREGGDIYVMTKNYQESKEKGEEDDDNQH